MTDQSTRPPNYPPSPPPPNPPPPAPPSDDLIFAAVELLDADLQTPARRDPEISPWVSAVATTGGPAVIVPGAEGLGCKGRGVGADAAATFTVPDTRVPLVFGEGRERLVGRVEPLPEVVGVGYDGPLPPSGLPRSRRSAWRMANQPIDLGDGPLYDALPGSPR